MRTRSIWLAPLALVALSTPQDDEALKARVDALETEVKVLQQYLQAQAAVAKKTTAALDVVEEEGFTAGINYKSREVLLEALREQAKAAQAKVPGAKPEPEEGDAPRRGRRGQ